MGTLWNRSGTIERYADDLRASGAKAYFYLGGTTTPLTVFADSAEASAYPHPLVADSAGRWPNVFVPYIQSYDVRVTSSFDEQLTFTQLIPNPDPVELSVTINPEEKVQTGMIHCELINGTRASYVRLNGRTIGNAASGATERANADTSNLFTYLWNALTNAVAPVSGGRGASASADFAANKALTLPSWQGAVPVGLDDMGGIAGGFFTGLTFLVGNATTAGSSVGSNLSTLVEANLPAHAHNGTTATEGAHTHLVSGLTSGQSQSHTHSGTTGAGSAHTHTGSVSDINPAFTTRNLLNDSTDTAISICTAEETTSQSLTINAESAHTHPFTSGNASQDHTHSISFTSGAGSLHSHTFTTGNGNGASTPFANLSRAFLVTWFIKL